MGKNILIFSDGTGQAGGLLPDETRSNIYKLYRATRCGPDSNVNPAEQLTFYDPGLGSKSDDKTIKIGWLRKLRNLISQGTGLGITKNIVDCYAAILKLWRPGDRVFLIGFSRGAYTVRCVGGVMSLCGIPTHAKGEASLKYDDDSIRKIAKEAVNEVYKYGASVNGDPFHDLRAERAAQFRKDYGCDVDGHANEYPYFVGVFDTVAALGVAKPIRYAIMGGGAFIGVLLAAFVAWVLSHWALSFWPWFAIFAGVPAMAAVVAYLWTHLRWHSTKKRFYLANWALSFYDDKLNRRVRYARHALSIDEARADFARVEWRFDGDAATRQPGEPEILRQVWFAGDHSDIGGSYIENEARLSDNSLQWMLEQARELPHPILVDGSVLRLYPSPEGPQHDECKRGFPGIWGKLGLKWNMKLRPVNNDAPLHSSVVARFAAGDVLQYNEMKLYRPEQLREHGDVKEYYGK